jgi:hypothetical protein
MNNVVQVGSSKLVAIAFDPIGGSSRPRAGVSARGSIGQSEPHTDERQFVAMSRVYNRFGGLLRGDDVAQLMRRHCEQPISIIARWIVRREILSFDWRSSTFVPLFQFDIARASLRPEVSQVIQELRPVFDDWDLASWFVHPNAFLNERTPVEAIAGEPEEVLEVARADRFIAAG